MDIVVPLLRLVSTAVFVPAPERRFTAEATTVPVPKLPLTVLLALTYWPET